MKSFKNLPHPPTCDSKNEDMSGGKQPTEARSLGLLVNNIQKYDCKVRKQRCRKIEIFWKDRRYVGIVVDYWSASPEPLVGLVSGNKNVSCMNYLDSDVCVCVCSFPAGASVRVALFAQGKGWRGWSGWSCRWSVKSGYHGVQLEQCGLFSIAI